MSVLIVHLPASAVTSTTEFDFVLTADGVTATRHGAAQAAVLPPPSGAGAQVVAIAPVGALSWHRIELPRGVTARSPRLRQVLEGLLEDRLLDDPETLHFALGPQARADTPVWVATCGRQWLRGALEALEAAGRPVGRIVPEFSPEGAPSLFAIGEPEHAQLVLAGTEGVAALPLAPASLALLPSLPDDTPFAAEPAVAQLAEEVIHHPPVLVTMSERSLQAARSGWDLAQFEFSRTGGARAMRRLGTAWSDLLTAPQWRPARWAVVALLLVNLVAINASAWRERSALDTKRASMQAMLTTTFPQVKVVVDAPLQMEKEVALLRQASGAASDRDLEAMLSALAVAASGQVATGIDYANGELRVRGLTTSDAVTAPLRARGYAATPRADGLVVTSEGTP